MYTWTGLQDGAAYAASLVGKWQTPGVPLPQQCFPVRQPGFPAKKLTGEWSRRVTKQGFSPEWKACGL